MKILIVDDQKRTRQSLRSLLNTLSFVTEIAEAEDGRQAMLNMAEAPSGIVVMDARMPRMDGVQAAGFLKERWPQTRLIILSMYPEYRQASLEAGADAFVSKGEPPEKLVEAISRLAGREGSA